LEQQDAYDRVLSYTLAQFEEQPRSWVFLIERFGPAAKDAIPTLIDILNSKSNLGQSCQRVLFSSKFYSKALGAIGEASIKPLKYLYESDSSYFSGCSGAGGKINAIESLSHINLKEAKDVIIACANNEDNKKIKVFCKNKLEDL
jgi:hypothetical protein